MRIPGKKVAILTVGILLVLSCCANGVILRFSLDGESEAPETLDAMSGDIFTMYIVSFSPGEPYWKEVWDPVGVIGDVWIYPEAGDLATITRPPPGYDGWVGIYIVAEDSMGNILAGKHFGFEVTVPSDLPVGESLFFQMNSFGAPDDSIRIVVVPEPATVSLLGIGVLMLLRRRRRFVG